MVIQFPPSPFPVGPVFVIKGIGFQTGVRGGCTVDVWDRREAAPRPLLCLAKGEGLKDFI